MNQLDKVNENSLHLLLAVALLSLIVFSQSGGIISTYGQLSPGNSNTTTQLDSAQKSPDNGQSIATPGPSENDLGITKEQSNKDQPQIQQEGQDKEEETSDNSDEVGGDNTPRNSEQDIVEEQEGQGDEEGKNNDDSEKENNDDIQMDWMPFP